MPPSQSLPSPSYFFLFDLSKIKVQYISGQLYCWGNIKLLKTERETILWLHIKSPLRQRRENWLETGIIRSICGVLYFPFNSAMHFGTVSNFQTGNLVLPSFSDLYPKPHGLSAPAEGNSNCWLMSFGLKTQRNIFQHCNLQPLWRSWVIFLLIWGT